MEPPNVYFEFIKVRSASTHNVQLNVAIISSTAHVVMTEQAVVAVRTAARQK